MKGTGAEALVATLQQLGVERVFGIPGIQTLELFDALADATFPTILTTDERSAAFMADAHARVTGRLQAGGDLAIALLPSAHFAGEAFQRQVLPVAGQWMR